MDEFCPRRQQVALDRTRAIICDICMSSQSPFLTILARVCACAHCYSAAVVESTLCGPIPREFCPVQSGGDRYTILQRRSPGLKLIHLCSRKLAPHRENLESTHLTVAFNLLEYSLPRMLTSRRFGRRNAACRVLRSNSKKPKAVKLNQEDTKERRSLTI